MVQNMTDMVLRYLSQSSVRKRDPVYTLEGVLTTNDVSDAIEERRVHALTQVKDEVDQWIELCRNYEDPVEQNWSFWGRQSLKMNAILISSHLRDETWKHFGLTCSLTFLGLSFENTAKWIRSMMNPADWRTGTAPPARTIPRALANLSSMFLGVDPHGAEDSTILSTHVHKELTNLITRLEAQDWGIDLDRVTSRPRC